MPDHAAITDPNVHEMKGINTAPANSVYVANGSGTGNWTVLPSTDPELITIPVGTLMFWPGSSVPSKWLLAFGQAISRTTYSVLFSKFGTTYGAGDGSTTFNIPDGRGRLLAGWDLAGTVSGNRLSSPIDGDTLGAVGGEQTTTVVAANVPPLSGVAAEDGSHTHTLTNGTNLTRLHTPGGDSFTSAGSANDSFQTPAIASGGSHSHSVTVNSTGDDPHSNLQPTIVLNMLVYTGVV